ncbi:MAG: sensor histidine kinase [Christensenellales bacterium]
MIKKLHLKYVLVTMLLISFVLSALFVVLYVSTSRRLYQESISVMEHTISMGAEGELPKYEIGGNQEYGSDDILQLQPTLYLEVSNRGSVVIIKSDSFVITDTAVLENMIMDCLNSNENNGIVAGNNFRFLKQTSTHGIKIAFLERSAEISELSALVRTLILAGVGSFLVFLAISFFLARWASKPVVTAWQKQQQFIADASHEIKTPLTVIQANANIVLAHPLDTVAQQSKWIEYIQTEARRMTVLVNDLLFLAKYNGKKTSLILSELNLSEAVLGALLPFESIVFEQKKTLRTWVDPDLHIMGEKSRIEQLVAILVDNALKYSEEEGIVNIALQREQDKIKLTVHNTGESILPEQLDRIFERFYRADPSRSRESGGYGLGLAIARSIVEMHGGQIKAYSEGKNTWFVVTFHVKTR